MWDLSSLIRDQTCVFCSGMASSRLRNGTTVVAAARLMEGWEVGKPVFQEPPGAPSPPPGGFLAAGALQGPMVAVTSAPPSPTPSPGVTPTCRDPSVPSPSICPARPLPRPLRKGSGWLDTDGGREEGRTLLEPPGQARKSRGTFPRALSVESCLHPRVTGSAGSGGSGPVDPIPPPPRPIREAEGKCPWPGRDPPGCGRKERTSPPGTWQRWGSSRIL